MVTIEMEGISEIRAKMAALADPTLVDQVINEGVIEGLTTLVSDIQNKATNWGRVKQRIQWGRFGPRDFWVGSDDPVAGYLEFGTRPHFIYPRYKQALRFRVDLPFTGMKGKISKQSRKWDWSKGLRPGDWYSKGSMSQHDVFAKFVRHPGTQPQPAIEPALNEWIPTVPDIIAQKLVNLVEAS